MKHEKNLVLKELVKIRTELAPLRFFFSHFASQGVLMTDQEDLQALGFLFSKHIQRLDKIHDLIEQMNVKS